MSFFKKKILCFHFIQEFVRNEPSQDNIFHYGGDDDTFIPETPDPMDTDNFDPGFVEFNDLPRIVLEETPHDVIVFEGAWE